MKKIISIFLVAILLISCSEEIKFSNPALQAYRDDVFFNGIDVKAYKNANGSITLVALAQDEEVEIDIASSAKGTYFFGTTNQNTVATYSSSFDDVELYYETKIVNGPVANISNQIIAGGTGYTSDCVLLDGGYACNSSHATTGGTGSGLTLSLITNASGVVTSVKVASPGNGYKAGDVITITGGGNNAKVRVLNVEGSNGEVIITEIGDTITGTFKFNAVNANNNPLGGELVNFRNGTFYRIPIIPAP
ncbi:DUF6252 family protein [Flavobacterium sp.]|uniref:DUF6252 family protein n=1 Tax=Flavobacterium sp. TaxID=239 RepID=UPI00260E3181|nr:DUF6252 family protein [Flavobacterium sp.]